MCPTALLAGARPKSFGAAPARRIILLRGSKAEKWFRQPNTTSCWTARAPSASGHARASSRLIPRAGCAFWTTTTRKWRLRRRSRAKSSTGKCTCVRPTVPGRLASRPGWRSCAPCRPWLGSAGCWGRGCSAAPARNSTAGWRGTATAGPARLRPVARSPARQPLARPTEPLGLKLLANGCAGV